MESVGDVALARLRHDDLALPGREVVCRGRKEKKLQVWDMFTEAAIIAWGRSDMSRIVTQLMAETAESGKVIEDTLKVFLVCFFTMIFTENCLGCQKSAHPSLQ